MSSLQSAFNFGQTSLQNLRLVLNADETKWTHNSFLHLPTIHTHEASLTFKPHVEQLVQNLKIKIGFLHQDKACFSIEDRLTIMSLPDWISWTLNTAHSTLKTTWCTLPQCPAIHYTLSLIVYNRQMQKHERIWLSDNVIITCVTMLLYNASYRCVSFISVIISVQQMKWRSREWCL